MCVHDFGIAIGTPSAAPNLPCELPFGSSGLPKRDCGVTLRPSDSCKSVRHGAAMQPVTRLSVLRASCHTARCRWTAQPLSPSAPAAAAALLPDCRGLAAPHDQGTPSIPALAGQDLAQQRLRQDHAADRTQQPTRQSERSPLWRLLEASGLTAHPMRAASGCLGEQTEW